MAVELIRPAALDAASVAAVRSLADRIEARDGQPPLSDRALTRLGSSAVHHVLAVEAGEVVGYGQVEDGNAEIALGVASSEILDELTPEITEIWSHGTRSALRPILEASGFRSTRILHQLRRPGDLALPSISSPPDIRIETFRRGTDEQAWLAVNAAAFAHHPEQGRVTLDELQALVAEPWFSEGGFFLAWREKELLGYHWTKIHPDGNGEVYVLGVSPAAQGLGLGRVLLDVGLRYLADRGCPEVLLYVDESNSGAMRLYEAAGFARYDADTQWTR